MKTTVTRDPAESESRFHIDIQKGAPQLLVASGAWGDDGQIVFCLGFVTEPALMKVSAQGGDRTVLLGPGKGVRDLQHVSLLPDGRGYLYVLDRNNAFDTISLLADGESKELYRSSNERFWWPVYSPTGHIIFYRQTVYPGIWALPFSLSTLRVTGQPFRVAEGEHPSVSNDGTLAYVSGARSPTMRQLVWVDEQGTTPAGSSPQEGIHGPVISESGELVLVVELDSSGSSGSIWLHSLTSTIPPRQITKPDLKSTDIAPVWHPDGEHVLFHRLDFEAGKSHIMMVNIFDGAEPKQITQGAACRFSGDGESLVFVRFSPETNRDIWKLDDLDAPNPSILLDSPSDEYSPRVCPNGKYLAYISSSVAGDLIYLTGYPACEGRWPVSPIEATGPFWSKTGDAIYYRIGSSLYRARIDIEEGQDIPTIDAPEEVLTIPDLGFDNAGLVPEPNGSRFLAVQQVDAEEGSLPKETGEPQGIVIIENWQSSIGVDVPQ